MCIRHEPSQVSALVCVLFGYHHPPKVQKSLSMSVAEQILLPLIVLVPILTVWHVGYLSIEGMREALMSCGLFFKISKTTCDSLWYISVRCLQLLP